VALSDVLSANVHGANSNMRDDAPGVPGTPPCLCPFEDLPAYLIQVGDSPADDQV